PFNFLIRGLWFDLYSQCIFFVTVKKTSPRSGVVRENNSALIRIIRNEQSIFSSGQRLSLNHNVSREFDSRVLICTGSPRRSFTITESLVNESNRHQLSPDLSVSSFYAGAVIMNADVC